MPSEERGIPHALPAEDGPRCHTAGPRAPPVLTPGAERRASAPQLLPAGHQSGARAKNAAVGWVGFFGGFFFLFFLDCWYNSKLSAVKPKCKTNGKRQTRGCLLRGRHPGFVWLWFFLSFLIRESGGVCVQRAGQACCFPETSFICGITR